MSVNLKNSDYIITSALMGFGHLRAAHNISGCGGRPIVRVDREPYVNSFDKFIWNGTQRTHTYASRDAESRNKLLYNWFEGVMKISDGDRPPSMAGSKFVHILHRLGMGRKFFESLDGKLPALVHTFYVHAMLSVYRKYPGRNYLLLCDTDFHRVWAPVNPEAPNIEYMVPIKRSADRLVSYGVPAGRIHVTGFPLPAASTGSRQLEVLKSVFETRRKRLKRNSDAPLTVMFPFSGAGAYSNVLAELVKSMLDHLREGSLRLIVSCGDNEHALGNAENLLVNYGLEESEYTEIIFDRDLFESFDKFNRALESTDVIITKPSEMVFYAGLGIPMVFLPPIGEHEARNREFLIENRCAVDIGNVSAFPRWLEESRKSEKLLELAGMGFNNVSKTGSFEIDELVSGNGSDRRESGRLETQEA